ncbi:ribonuclease P [Candidatus Micrarchaeota archaeon]|nr:ribonuclease P [Candidatus Micrarchaeota archaeon]
MNRDRRQKPALLVQIVRERIERLFSLAKQNFSPHPERSKRYMNIARRLSTRYLVRFSSEQKKQFCKQCSAFLAVGKNARVRLREGKIELKCLECGKVKSTPFKKAKKPARA